MASVNGTPRTGIVVPCYNEAQRLRVSDFEEFLAARPPRATLVFVDDGSRDGTAEILQQLHRAHPDRTQVLSMPRNSGKAEAVRTGIEHCLEQGFTFTGFWDADLATPLSAIRDFLDLLESRAHLDMVFGSRVKLLGRAIERKPARHYIGRGFATAVSTILRLPVYDTQCGAKIFRATPEIRAVFGAPFLSRWIFDVEIIARYILEMKSTKAAAERIYEFPLNEWRDISDSKLGVLDFVVAAYDLLRIYRMYRIR
jgi:dolichyl-phosphate beta-glucosyltransferase